MKNLFLLNRSGMGPDVMSRKGRYSLDPILSRLCLTSLICLCMLTVGVGNVWGADETVTWSVSTSTANTISKDSGTLPTGASASMSSNDSQTDKSQLTSGKKQTFTLTGMDGCTIKGVTINMRKSSKGSSATVTVKVGSTTLQSGQSISLSTTAGDKTVTLANTTTVVGTSENVVITVTAAKSSAYVLKYKVTYEAGGGGTPTCATPTFSPAAGSYIGTQSVTISSTTTGSTIYYTTNGSTPTTSSSSGSAGAASATVSVSSSQTLKAYAVKAGSDDSEVATATYTIVSCDHDDFDWDLRTNSYTTGPGEEVTWSGTYATMHNEGTNATNYLGGDANSRTSSRFYSGNALTITPASGVTISHVVFTATTDGYASTLRGSTWTNAAASGSGSYVIVTPTDGTSAFSATVGGTCGFTNVNVCYTAASCGSAPTVSAGSLKGSVSSSSSATAQCTGGITNIGGAGCSLTSYGFAVGTSSNPTIGGTLTGTGKTYAVGSSIAASTGFEKLIDGLSASTTYYVRPYATNGYDTGYGTQFSFTTLAACTTAPTVTAGSKGTITSTTAAVTCASGLSSLGTGGCSITSYGFVYGTSANPTTSNSTTEVGTSIAASTSFNTTLTGLTEGTLYYVRPYATNGYGTGYGTQVSFGTPKITVSQSSRAFGDRAVGGSYEMTFTVEGVYLQGNISIAKSGTNQAMFSIDNATITQTDGTAPSTTITVTYTPSTAGSHSATLTLTSTNATNKTVSLSGTGKYKVTWMAGDQEFNSQIGDADVALTNPGTPAPATYCPGGKVFVGWTATPIVGTTNTQPADLFTDATKKTIPAGGATYYAVYATSSGTPSTSYAAITSGLASGNYVIAYEYNNNGTRIALQNIADNSDASNRMEAYALARDGSGKYANPSDTYIWQLQAQDGGGYYIYDLATGMYLNATTSALQLSTTPTKYDIAYDGTNSRWKIQLNSNSSYYVHGYTGTYTDFRVSTSGSDGKYRVYLYKNEGTQTFSAYATTCCTDWSTPTVSYSSSLAINASEGVTIGSGTTHGAVTYESSDEDVLTVDADGTIHAVGAGTAHIIATWAGETISSTTYCEKSANSNDVTVSGIQVTGTTPVNFGQVYQNAAVANKTIYVTGLGLASPITPSLPVGSPFSFSPASLAKDCSGATLTISASTATLGTYNQTLTLTSGTFSATVTVKMEVIAMPSATFTDALHGLTEDEDGVSLSSYNLTAAQGTAVVFPTLANQTKSAGTCEGEYYIFVGWTEGDNNTDPEDHLVTSYTLANGDTKNYYAVWADGAGTATYTKLTSNSFSGSPAKYVLGAEHEGTTYYFSDYDPDNIAYNLSWGTCSSSDAPIQFTLSGTASALVAKDNLNNYLEAPCTTKAFYISGSETSVELKSNGTIYNNGDGCTSYHLRYNYNSGSGGLRWYTSDTGDPAYFYLVGAAGTVHYRTSCCANKVDAPVVTATTVTSTSITLTWPSDDKATSWQIEWNGAGGWVTPSGSCTHTVSGLTPNTTYTWRVRATYEDPVCGADVRSGSTTTNQVYHVTYAKGSGTGTCTAEGSTTDATGYEAGATVTLQENGFSLSGHTFAGWTEDDEDITISSNQLTMPDHDVVITASWTAKMDKYFDRMHDQTDALHGGVEETEGTNEGKYYIPKEGCNYSIPTAVDSNTGDACQTSHYKLQGWIAASHMKGYPNNMTGEIKPGEETYIFPPTGTKTATGATYYAIWAEVTE